MSQMGMLEAHNTVRSPLPGEDLEDFIECYLELGRGSEWGSEETQENKAQLERELCE